MGERGSRVKHGPKYFAGLSIAALGVVFGDIGTSPLYALRESLSPAHGVELTREAIFGVLSLILWSLVLIVTVKYLFFVLRADNQGEGGMLALMALIHPEEGAKRKLVGMVAVGLGLFGAALLYGDGMLTPAISVLSAMEGVKLVEPAMGPYVIPMTIAVLVGLFLFQKRGTATVGAFFGPVTFVWFVTLAALGVRGIALHPDVLGAINPLYAVQFLMSQGTIGFFVLGAVFLSVTGAEALYADMGHFGRGPIRLVWFIIVFPALTLNYFGQGALLLADPAALESPFYLLAPEWARGALVVLATAATIIASQAVISGAFSITRQAVSLGYSPRVEVRHTSEREMGQIYIPPVNWILMIATIILVLEFQTSSALAAAYGVAVSTDMIITSILFYLVARRRWGWNPWLLRVLVGAFLSFELAFWTANIIKVPQGGWFPLAVAAVVFTLMMTWRDGRRVLGERLREVSRPIDVFLSDIPRRGYARVRGYAIYMTGNPKFAPPALIKNLEHNRTLHMQAALLTIITEDVPRVPRSQRLTVEALPHGFYRVVARYGFMDEPNAPEVMRLMKEQGLDWPLRETTFFLGRERLISTDRPGMSRWRERLFAFMASNSQQATSYFRIPPDRVIEVGSQVEV